MSDEKEVVKENVVPLHSIKLTKYAHNYGWEIKISGTDINAIYEEINRQDQRMRLKYGKLK